MATIIGRPLAGNAANLPVAILQPGSRYNDRLNQLDFRVGKILRFGQLKTTANVDLYNVLNANPVLAVNQNFGAWLQPTTILTARVVKLSAQVEW